jgi:uroporphyrin-III C-methyltransferase
MMKKVGRLTVVGTGIRLIGQCSAEALDHISNADIVFSVMGNPVAECWLRTLNPNMISLQTHYRDAPDRPAAYRAMAETIVAAVREGKDVCAAFYGHPGVFVGPSHAAVRQLRTEGFDARILPGISAEDCLFADLEVDPAVTGCQSFEASDFFFNKRVFDTSAALILWQIAVLGDDTYSAFEAQPHWLKALAQVLMEHYPADHKVTIYEAATLPTTRPRKEELALRDLGKAAVTQASTLYVPPCGTPTRSSQRVSLLQSCRASYDGD